MLQHPQTQHPLQYRIFLLTIALLIFSSSTVFASDFGNIFGELYFHGESINSDFEEKIAFINSHLGLKYETPELHGMSLAAEVRNGAKIWERNRDDADIATGTLFSEAYIQYVREALTLRLGRQGIEQEWIEDFHEAATLSFIYDSIFEIFGGYTRSFAIADEEEIFSEFEDIGKHGSSFLYMFINNEDETWSFNPYGLHTPDFYTAYGAKLTVSLLESLDLGIHYAGSDVKETTDEDTSIFHGFAIATLDSVEVEVGFLQAGNDGVGFLDFLGELVNPFEEGNLVFEADATTLYSILTYAFDAIELQLIIGNTNAADSEENEISFLLNYDLEEILEGASLETIYTSVNSENDLDDFTRVLINIKYEFVLGSHDS